MFQYGKLSCFRCFDGTIVLKNQVCDGTVDCQDLSDECACEKSEARPLCPFFHEVNGLNYKKYNFTLLCNLEYDLPGGVDEKYCSTEIIFSVAVNYFQIEFENLDEQRCAKGQTAFNRSFDVVSGEYEDITMFKQDYLSALFLDSYYNDSKNNMLMSYDHKVLNSLSDLRGSCNWEIECPYKEDECSQECFKIMKFHFFIHSFFI